nr:unnamed protein product [Digitaria exilis]
MESRSRGRESNGRLLLVVYLQDVLHGESETFLGRRKLPHAPGRRHAIAILAGDQYKTVLNVACISGHRVVWGGAVRVLDDAGGKNAAERERKASYLSSCFYGRGGQPVRAHLVWSGSRESSAGCSGHGVCAGVVRRRRPVPPVVSPLKGACQVLGASAHKASVRVPDNTAEFYEAASVTVKTPRGLRGRQPVEEELKTLLRMIPIWLTRTPPFVRQGTTMDSRITGGAFSVPAASPTSIRMMFSVASIALYNRFLGRAQAFTPLQLMRLGHATVALAAAGAAPMGIDCVAATAVEFFYDQAGGARDIERRVDCVLYFPGLIRRLLSVNRLLRDMSSTMAQATENPWWSLSPEEKKRTVQVAWAATLMDDLDMRDDQDDDVAVAYGVPASKQAIIDLCVPTWGEAKENEGHDGCVVCLEGLGIDQELRMMPCKHTFHKLCIFNKARKIRKKRVE